MTGRLKRGRTARTGLALLVLLALALPALGQEQPSNRAALVIRHGDGQLVTACVPFAEPEISGLELLERSGVAHIAQGGGAGAAVCQIEGEGCAYPAEDCFCRCKGAECVYWAYARLRDGRWDYSSQGASAARVRHGDVDGWAWGAGTVEHGAQPPALSFAQVCADAAQADGTPAAGEPADTPRVPAGQTPPAPQAGAAQDSPASAAPADDAGGGQTPLVSYLAFGALALVLLGGIVAARRRG